MGALLHALHAHQPLPTAPAQNAHVHPLFAGILNQHAALPRGPYPTAKWPEGLEHLPAADGHQHAELIRKHPSYSAQELADIISAVASHAAHLDRVGLDRFGEVSDLMDRAADIAEDSFYNPELAR